MNISEFLKRVGRSLWSFRQSRAGFIVLWLLVIAFLGKAALDSYSDYESLSLSVEWATLGIALIVLAGRNLATPLKWMYMLNVEGGRMGYAQTARAFYLSQLSSLIPGGVWQYLDFGYRASEQGKSLDNVAHTAVYVQGMTVATGLFYAAVMAALYLPKYAVAATAAAVAVLVTALFSADLLQRLKSFLDRFDVETGEYSPERKHLLYLFVIALAIWPIEGAVLFFLVASLTPIPAQLFIPISGIMAASWAAGFLVLILPGGLGVREGTMIFMLSSIVPPPAAIAVSVIARIATLAAKVVSAAFFGVFWRGGGDG